MQEKIRRGRSGPFVHGAVLSQLTYTSEDHSDTFDVTTCSLDAPEAFPPDSHEWTAEKLSWIELWTLPNVKEI